MSKSTEYALFRTNDGRYAVASRMGGGWAISYYRSERRRQRFVAMISGLGATEVDLPDRAAEVLPGCGLVFMTDLDIALAPVSPTPSPRHSPRDF